MHDTQNQPAQPPPPTAVSDAQVERLASIGATEQEICEYLGINPDQLNAQFGPILRSRWAWFRITLRQKQFVIATQNKGDLRMLQWLGRFNLRQSTSPQQTQPSSQSPIKTYIGINPENV